MSTIVDWLEAADPDAVAVIDDAGSVTYRDLLAEATDLAKSLARELGTGRYLLIPAEKRIAFLRVFVAAILSGNTPVPIDPQAPDRSVAAIGRLCGNWACLRLDRPDGWTNAQATSDPPLRGDRPELVLFTSGTSGMPKGVPVSTENLRQSASAVSDYLGYRTHRSAAVVLPLHYSYALLSQVLFMFYAGGCVRLFESFRNPIAFAREVDAAGIATFCGVPSTFAALCTLHGMSKLLMPSVRVVCSAGAAMDRGLVPTIKEIFPNASFFDNYGMTEATPRISFIRDDDPRFGEPTCGKPIAGLEARVLDERTFTPVADGEAGIIAVRGANVFSGYLHDAAATEKAFTPDGFLLCGDIGHMRDGYIYLHGRRDEVFNVGGEKVAPAEIERALAEHPSLAGCAVRQLSDPRRGDIPVAYVQLRVPVTRRDLVAFLNSRLSPSKVPVRYFAVRGLPMTPNGKLQRNRLSPDNSDFVIDEIT